MFIRVYRALGCSDRHLLLLELPGGSCFALLNLGAFLLGALAFELLLLLALEGLALLLFALAFGLAWRS